MAAPNTRIARIRSRVRSVAGFKFPMHPTRAGTTGAAARAWSRNVASLLTYLLRCRITKMKSKLKTGHLYSTFS